MPTYEYECKSCGQRFEHFQKMTDEPLDKCPKCKKQVRRLIGNGAGIIFKGSGFYATDYRKSSYKERQKSDSSAPCDKAGPSCQGCPQAAAA
jgi:putative FmdB family regulatory protein